MTNPMAARCDVCVYGVPLQIPGNLTGEKLMECRIDPPTLIPTMVRGAGAGLNAAFRLTKPEWWCGKFKGAVNG